MKVDISSSDPKFHEVMVAQAISTQLAKGLPITNSIRYAVTFWPKATKQEVIAACKSLGLNESTAGIQFNKARKEDKALEAIIAESEGVKPRATTEKKEKAPKRQAKHDPDLPKVGAKINFVDTSMTARMEGRLGNVVSGVVTGHRGREIIVQPDCTNRPTWIYKSNLR